MTPQISQPRWKMPEYTQRQINDAGDTIRNNTTRNFDQKIALQI